MADTPPGIPAHDLARDMTARARRALAQLLAADAKAYSPLRVGLSAAEMEAHHRRITEQNQARERRVSVALSAALVDWEITRQALAGAGRAIASPGLEFAGRQFKSA